MDDFPAIMAPALRGPAPIEPVEESVLVEYRREARRGYLPPLPLRVVEVAAPIAGLAIVSRSYVPLAPVGGAVATLNQYRHDAHDVGVYLCHAANSHRELVAALRFIAAAATTCLAGPRHGDGAAGALRALRESRDMALDTLARRT